MIRLKFVFSYFVFRISTFSRFIFKGFRKIPNRRAYRPLRGFDNTNRPAHVSHDYLMKIVPTIYENLSGSRRYPYQFTYFYRVSVRSLDLNLKGKI